MNYITTSRKPSINTRLFAKDLAGILSAEYLTRGKSSMSDLVNVARYNGVKKVFILTERSGNPNQIVELSVDVKTWEFSNTYFITLHKLVKSLTKSNFRVRTIHYETLSKAMHHLIRNAKINSDYDSEFSLVDKDSIVTLYRGDKEVGPRFKIYYKE